MFPLLYHAHHTLHMEDLPFWEEMARQQGDPILELGCGTGRLLLPLMKMGYRVIGLDRDLDMLAFLRRALPAELQPQVCIFQADMAAFSLADIFRAEIFRLIFLPCNTLSTLTRPVLRGMLAGVRRHLDPKGAFVASLPNPTILLAMPTRGESEVEEIFLHPLTGNPVQVSSAWRRSSRGFNLWWMYDHLLPDGQVQRTTLEVKHELRPPEVYLEEFYLAGLKPAALYGDYDFSAYTPESQYLILVANLA